MLMSFFWSLCSSRVRSEEIMHAIRCLGDYYSIFRYALKFVNLSKRLSTGKWHKTHLRSF